MFYTSIVRKTKHSLEITERKEPQCHHLRANKYKDSDGNIVCVCGEPYTVVALDFV